MAQWLFSDDTFKYGLGYQRGLPWNFELHNAGITSRHCCGLVMPFKSVMYATFGRVFSTIHSTRAFEIKQDNMLNFASHLVLPFSLLNSFFCGLFSKCQNKFLKTYPPYVMDRSSSKQNGRQTVWYVSLCLTLVCCCLSVNVASLRTNRRMIVAPLPNPTQSNPFVGQLQGLVQV